LTKEKIIRLDTLDRIISGTEAASLADEIGERSLTLVRNGENLLPLDRSKKISVIGISNGFDGPGTMSSLLGTLRQGGLKFKSAYVQENSLPDQFTAARKAIADADVVILGLYGRVRTGAKNSVGLPENGVALVQEALSKGKKVIGVSFGNPYTLTSFPQMQTYLVAYGDMPSLQRGAGRGLLGTQNITGKLPITLPGLHPRGTGIQLTAK
jgi:beta-N-acetylhexosaminidase